MKKQSNLGKENVYVNDGTSDQNDETGYEEVPNINENTPYTAVC